MKKVCMLLVILSFVSVMPSFGMKIIVNNNMDRIVPSRSSVLEYENYNYENNNEEYVNITETLQKDKFGYQGIVFERLYRPLLKQDIRSELKGTTWVYPKLGNIEVPQKTIKEIVQELPPVREKRYIREAADYYIIDTLKDPNNAFPAEIQ